jgi:hypothetical protein
MIFILVETFREKLGDLDAILRHALDSHGRLDGWARLAVGPASAALVPLDEREILLPACEQGIRERAQGVTWSTM